MNRQLLDFNKHIIRILRIAALFTGAAILFYGCENDLEKIKPFVTPENLPVAEATNIETLFTDSGKVRFFVKAPRLLSFETEETSFVEFPEGIELVKYNENQEIISSITADYARQFEDDKRWEAKNNVVATNAQGDTLKTELLIWEEDEERIHTDEFVEIIRPDQIITGIGFTSDQALQNWRIKDPKGTIYINLDDGQSGGEGNEGPEQFEIPERQPENPSEIQN